MTKSGHPKFDYFRIGFAFKNDYGKIVEAKTIERYNKAKSEELAAMETFPIKYMGNEATIISN